MTYVLDPDAGTAVPDPHSTLEATPHPVEPHRPVATSPVPAGPVNMENATPLYESLLTHFPFSEIRAPQVRGLEAWANAINKGKTFAIMELPTGAGKSGLAWTIGSHATTDAPANYRPGAYVLTTQKALQEQYMRDFQGKGMMELKGAANYRCHDFQTDCQTGALLRKASKKPEESCGHCAYKAAKAAFACAPIGVTNFAYFLSEVKHIKMLPPRSVLIVDEAHNTETQILGQVEIEITRARCEAYGAMPPGRIPDGAILDARAYVLDQFLPKAEKALADLKTEAATVPWEERGAVLKKVAAMEQYVGRIDALADIEACRDWFCNVDSNGTLKLRPLTAANYAHEALFRMGRQVLFLSATILDAGAFARGLGLDPSQGGFCRVESDFPVGNRPIHFHPAGSMAYKNKAATIPRLLKFIERILEIHPNEKGIIHAQSYQLTRTIVDYLATTKHASRVLAPEAGFDQRKAYLAMHHESPEPTVLVSPSMTEGLDLHGDLSRFQVIPKIPYPALGDPFIKARMEHDERWYGWQTALTLVQATGRSIRSRDDRATTYVLDADFTQFMARCGAILPKWWKDAVIYHK